jgi:uncharacterized membrane protein YphA (DoxX/SURF4 family)
VFTSPAVVDDLLVTIRIAVGLVLIGTSAQILFGWFGGSGLRGFARRAEQFGVRGSMAFALLAGLSSAVSGVGMVLGGFASIAALTLVAFMIAGAGLWQAGEVEHGGVSFAERVLRIVALVCLADCDPVW